MATRRRAGAFAHAALPPGPRWPAPVQTLAWLSRPGPLLARCRARYGDLFTIRVLYEGSWVMLADPDAVQEVFAADPAALHAGEANAVLGPVLGEKSVLLLDERDHLIRRKLMLPWFRAETLRGHAGLIAEVAQREVDRWPLGEPFSLLEHMRAITLEVMMRAVLGVAEPARLDRLRGPLRELLEWSTAFKPVVSLLTMGPTATRRFTALPGLLRRVDAAIFDEIARHREDPQLAERSDVLSLLLRSRYENGEPLSERDLRDQLVTLLLAGRETTATALAWALERLVHAPAVLDRLRARIADGDEDYLEAVCKETLRLRPVLPIVGRRLLEPMKLHGWLLPAGTSVAPCIYLLHRRADLYPEPARFHPERFLGQPAGTYTWIPFGGGVRRCLGASFALLEMREVLRVILTRVQLQATREHGERVRRHAVIWAPDRGGEVLASRADEAPRASLRGRVCRGSREREGVTGR